MENGVLRTSISKDSDSSQTIVKTSSDMNFLFVNETAGTGKPTKYKVGYSPAIRSHVRRHRDRHKTAGRAEAKESGSTRDFLIPLGACQDDPPGLIHDPECASCLVGSIIPSSSKSLKAPETDCSEDDGRHYAAYKRRLDGMADTLALIQHPLAKQAKVSPLEILGAGRSDPFLAYPVEKPSKGLHELMDLVVTYFLPGLCPDNAPRPSASSGANIVSKAWFTAGLKNPLLFHALAFGGLIHTEFLRYNQIYSNSIRALPHKLLVIQKLNEAMATGRDMTTDDVILAMLVLHSNDNLKVTMERRRPFDSPLRRVQWINVYGHIKYLPEHINAILGLLSLRGGLETLQMPGLAEMIVGGDLISAMNNFSHPIMPVLRSHENYIATVKVWAMTHPDTSTSTHLLSSTFWRIQQHGITDCLLQVLDAMGAVTLAIKHYLLRTPGSLNLGQVAQMRTAVQKRLLLVPTASELYTAAKATETSTDIEIYECCRLAAMTFSIAVIVPIPYTYDILQIYVTHLKTAIEVSGLLVPQTYDCAFGSQTDVSDLDKFLLWVLILGGIASLDKLERGWFVAQLKIFKEAWGLDWCQVLDIMGTFLWLDSACSNGGEELWTEVELFKD